MTSRATLSVRLLAVAAFLFASTGAATAQGLVTGARLGGIVSYDNRSVQRDLKLTPGQIARLTAAQHQVSVLGVRPRASQQGAGDLVKRWTAAQLEADRVAGQTLNAQQKARVVQIGLQIIGPILLRGPRLSRTLQITPAQAGQIRKITSEMDPRVMAATRGIPSGNLDQRREARLHAIVKSVRDATNVKCLSVLTPAQRAKWRALIGKPFKYVWEPHPTHTGGTAPRRR